MMEVKDKLKELEDCSRRVNFTFGEIVEYEKGLKKTETEDILKDT